MEIRSKVKVFSKISAVNYPKRAKKACRKAPALVPAPRTILPLASMVKGMGKGKRKMEVPLLPPELVVVVVEDEEEFWDTFTFTVEPKRDSV